MCFFAISRAAKDREPAVRAWKPTGDANVLRRRAELGARWYAGGAAGGGRGRDEVGEGGPLGEVFNGWGTSGGARFW